MFGTCCNWDDMALLTLPNLSVTELVVTDVALDKNELKVLLLVGEPGTLPPLLAMLLDLVFVLVVVEWVPKGFLETVAESS